MRLAALAMTAVIACGGGPRREDTVVSPVVEPAATPLYTRLGGRPAVAAIVERFMAGVLADVRLSAFFANTDLAAFQARLVEQLCVVTGGTDCAYTGRALQPAHAGMALRDEHVDAALEALGRALDAAAIAVADRDELLELVERMRPELVEP